MKKLAPEYRDNVPNNLISAGNVTVQVATFATPPPSNVANPVNVTPPLPETTP
jgi:hypothetical protein